MEHIPLVFEDFYDALRHLVQASGGAKRVAVALWPEKTPDTAGRYLMDCLNPGRAEKLDLEQLLALLRIGHQAGCHTALHFLCHNAGYSHPEPIEPDDERAELQRQFIAGVSELRQILNRIQPGVLK